METRDELLETVKVFEGCKLYAYRDSGGTVTIGYGHTGKGVRMGMAITQQQADDFLREDLLEVRRQVDALGLAGLTQGQRDALVDFTFNLGIGNLRKSTLLRYIKTGKTQLLIVREFMRWVYCNGRTLPGLVKRRQWEAERYVGKPIYRSGDDLKWYIRKSE